jgi:hypothetical protein
MTRKLGGYVCDGCGDFKEYLSESWSTISLMTSETEISQTCHFCLECRSKKLAFPPKEES